MDRLQPHFELTLCMMSTTKIADDQYLFEMMSGTHGIAFGDRYAAQLVESGHAARHGSNGRECSTGRYYHATALGQEVLNAMLEARENA